MKKPEKSKSGIAGPFPQKRGVSLFLSVVLLLCLAPCVTGEEVVLIRGNHWVTGIPGFGINGFSALAGEYRFQNTGDFSVYLTREPLYFSAEWQTRPGTGDISVVQRQSEEGYFAATVLDDGRETAWIAVFLFPRGLEGAGIGGSVFNRMLRVWTSRLSYFISLAKTARDVSLPAAVEF